MIELIVLNYLKSALSVPVSMEKPTDKSLTEYVVIEMTGGGQTDFINTAVFVIQSYAKSLYEAAELNEQVKLAMLGDASETFGIIAATDISKCDLNSNYNFTDTSTKSYRYQAVYDMVF